MLELKNIVKNYVAGDTVVQALKGIDLTFGKSEFVSILGPSGCGKTTLLNIIGGLDRYTEGDLIINGTSTKMYRNADWDAYRNRSIGFVFQNYNLIPHLTVLGNVEIAMTLSGVSPAERKKRAAEALKKVGLENQLNKKPNQLSGGQMQRVAIARAIVNDPEIILADEPTGALDSVTSVQIADLLKEISKDRLIIMVTHNDKLAEQYSTRIIRLLDGAIVDDTDPQGDKARQDRAGAGGENAPLAAAEPSAKGNNGKKQKKNKTSMSFFTALSLSFKNLITKKGRTFMTSFAGSIGIIGIALVLAVSNGFSIYIDNMQSDMLSGFPVTVDAIAMDLSSMQGHSAEKKEKFPDSNTVIPYENTYSMGRVNLITDEYIRQVESLNKDLYNAVNYTYSVQINVLSKSSDGTVKRVITSKPNDLEAGYGSAGSFGTELLQNREFLQAQYDVLGGGKYPENKDEVALVVDKYNRISTDILDQLNIAYQTGTAIDFNDLLGKEFSLVHNNDFYEKQSDTKFTETTDLSAAYDNENNLTLKLVGIMRVKETAPLELLSSGLVYTPALTQYVLENSQSSDIVTAQKAALENYSTVVGVRVARNVLTQNMIPLDEVVQSGFKIPAGMLSDLSLQIIGGLARPSAIQIYPKNFETKEQIKDHLNKYNDRQTNEQNKIVVTDMSSLITSTMNNMVNIISYVLVAFAAISLVVSSIMIGIITYVSVIERTKEIGVLRSIGARKKDISRVFNAETLIIGFAAGLIGILISFILTFPINAIITAIVAANGMSVGNMAVMNPLHALILIVVSMALTLIAGLIPSRVAAKKDPVVALRSE